MDRNGVSISGGSSRKPILSSWSQRSYASHASSWLMTPEASWDAYDLWLQDERIGFLDEPPEIETPFRSMTRSRRSAPKDWADSYLAAFAQSCLLYTSDAADDLTRVDPGRCR